MINYWGLIIRTNKYAGNFERDLCAHCTGQIGECGVGGYYITNENKNLFNGKNNIGDIITHITDEDDGCRRPCSMWIGDEILEEGIYTSVIIYFEDKPSQNAINIIKERSKTFLDAVKEKARGLLSN